MHAIISEEDCADDSSAKDTNLGTNSTAGTIKIYSKKDWRSSKAAIVAVASLAVFVDMLLYGLLFFIQPRILAACGLDPVSIKHYSGFLVGAYSLGVFLSTPFFGILSDRYLNRKVPMYFGLISIMGSTIILAHVRNVYVLILARFLQGVSAAATWAIGFAMVADAYGEGNSDGENLDHKNGSGIGFAMGVISASHTVGNSVGPLIGGFMTESFGLKYPFYFCIALTFVDLIARMIIKPAPPKASPKTNENGMSLLCKDRNIQLCMLAEFIESASFTGLETFFSQWLEESPWSFSLKKISLIFLAIVISNAMSSLIFGFVADRSKRQFELISFGLLVNALGTATVPLAWNTISLVVICFVYGALGPIMMTPMAVYLTNIVESKNMPIFGQLYALQNMVYSAGMMIGPILVGFLMPLYGFFWSLVPFACLTGLLTVAFFYLSTPLSDKKINFETIKSEDKV